MNDERHAAPSVRRTVGGGATLALASSLLTAVAGGLLAVLVARLVGPAGTGVYSVSATTLLLGVTLGTFGINVGATYFAGAGRWQAGEALRQLVLGALGAGLVCATLGLALVLLARDSLFESVPLADLLIVLGALPFAIAWSFVAALALGTDRYEMYAIAPLLTNGGALLISAALTPLAGVTGAVAALAGGHVLSAVIVGVWAVRSLPRPRPGWLGRARRQLTRALGFGLQGYAPQALQFLNYRADLFILNAVASSAVVGRYGVALAVTEMGALLPRALSAVVMPRVSALDTGRAEHEQRFLIEKSVRHTLLLLPVVGLLLAGAVVAIPLVFGPGFGEAVGPGLILVPGVLCLGVANVLGATVVGKGRPILMLAVVGVATPPTLALFLLLIPELEAYGAALASTASYLVTAVLSAAVFARVADGGRLRSYLPTGEDLHDYRALGSRGRSYLAQRLPRRRR